MTFLELQKSKRIQKRREKSKYNFDINYEYERYKNFQKRKQGPYSEWRDIIIAENPILWEDRGTRNLENFKRYCLALKRNYESDLSFYESGLTFATSSILTVILVFITLMFEAMRDEWDKTQEIQEVVQLIAETSQIPYILFTIIILSITVWILVRKYSIANHVNFYSDVIEIVENKIHELEKKESGNTPTYEEDKKS